MLSRAGGVFLITFVEGPTAADFEEFALVEPIDSGHGQLLWWSRGNPQAVACALHRALIEGRVRSAAFLPRIPAERLWLAYEWQGALVVDADLVELLGVEEHAWAAEQHYTNLQVIVLRPQQPGVRKVEGPAAYSEAIRSGEPVVAEVVLEEVVSDLESWFGALACPSIGGAVALLSMSGATRSGGEVLLRSPAALGMTVEDKPGTLAHYCQVGAVRARGVATSAGRLAEALGVPESGFRAEVAVWQEQLRRFHSMLTSADYVVLLELEAPVDPEFVLGEGLVVEQTSLNDVQTLAVARTRAVGVDMDEIVPVALPAWCMNQHLAPPNGQPVRATPLRFPIGREASRAIVWRRVNDYLRRSAR